MSSKWRRFHRPSFTPNFSSAPFVFSLIDISFNQFNSPDDHWKSNWSKKLVVFPEHFHDRSIFNSDRIDLASNLITDITWDGLYCAPDTLSLLLTTMHLNCRSVLYNVGEVKDLLNLLTLSILALTEIWLNADLADSINITG